MAAPSSRPLLSHRLTNPHHKPLPHPYSHHLLFRPFLPNLSTASTSNSNRSNYYSPINCRISSENGDVSDEFLSTNSFYREFSVIANMLKQIEPLDTSVISKGVSDSVKESMNRMISSMLGLLPSDQFSVRISVSKRPLVRLLASSVITGAGISAKKEAPVNFLTDPAEGRSTLRPADLLVFGWERGKHACVDLTGVSPLVGLRETGFVAGQASRKAESKKVDKHAKACAENQHVFIPLAFDTFGSLAPEAIRFLTRVQQVVHSNSSSPEGQGFVFSRLGFAIQKGVAAQLVARLPSIVM